MESPVNQRAFTNDNYENIKAYLGSLGIDFTKRFYVFLDEIQNVRNLPSAVKYLYDHNEIKFYLIGSSSFYLKNWFSEVTVQEFPKNGKFILRVRLKPNREVLDFATATLEQ